MTTQLWALALILIGTAIGAVGPIFFKKASTTLSFNPIKLIKNRMLILGFLFYGTALVTYLVALRGGDLSILYPLVSINYIWVCFLSIKFLNEKMNLYKWLGIVLIIFGVSMIGIGS